MTEAWQAVCDTFQMTFPKPAFVLLITAATVYAIFKRKKSRPEKAFITYSFLILALFLLPVTEKLIGEKMRDGVTYWRFLWLFPYAYLIAWAAVQLVMKCSKKAMQFACGAAIAAAILLTGRMVYNGEVFQSAENREKVPAIVLTAVSTVRGHAEKEGESNIRLMTTSDIITKITQVDGTIHTAVSRVWHPAWDDPDHVWDDVQRMFSGYQAVDTAVIPEGLEEAAVNYTLIPASFGAREAMQNAGWQLIYETDDWQIWYDPGQGNDASA